MHDVMLLKFHAFSNGSIENIKSIFNLKKSSEDFLQDLF